MEMKTKPTIENVSIEKLKAYDRNARTHSFEQVAQIAASMVEFGFTNPVLIDKHGTIVAGHGRVEAARSLGLEDVPCIRLEHLTEDQVRAYCLADNKLALNAGWNMDTLAAELKGLEAVGFDMSLTGFSPEELAEIMGDTVEDTDPEEPAPEVEFSEELLHAHNYVVLYFDNPLDWQVAQEKFGLKEVKDLIPRKGQPTGIGRVIRGSEWLNRIA
jgi:ParB-like chromosome segregation protein Spo0J